MAGPPGAARDTTAPDEEPTYDAGPFARGVAVMHETFGEGVVEGVEGRRLLILFDDVGYRTLAVDVVREGEGLLTLREG